MQQRPTSRWPGHIPGRFYFGMTRLAPTLPGAFATPSTKEVESYGVHRLTVPWGFWSELLGTIKLDHATGRLPWVSVRPPRLGPEGWHEVAVGDHDEAIHQLAERLSRDLDLPAVLTFDPDPSAIATDKSGPIWAQAYCRFHDIVTAAAGLRMVAEAPIIGDWLFNPSNQRQQPGSWLRDDVLERSSLLGVNMFENSSGETFERRVPRILDWLTERGHEDLMIGIAGSGRTEYAPPYIAPERWLSDSLNWVAKHTDRVGVVCYTSSSHEPSVFWTPAELSAPDEGERPWLGRAIIHC